MNWQKLDDIASAQREEMALLGKVWTHYETAKSLLPKVPANIVTELTEPGGERWNVALRETLEGLIAPIRETRTYYDDAYAPANEGLLMWRIERANWQRGKLLAWPSLIGTLAALTLKLRAACEFPGTQGHGKGKRNSGRPKRRKWDHVWDLIIKHHAQDGIGMDDAIADEHNKLCAAKIKLGKCKKINAEKVAQIRYEHKNPDRHSK